MLDRHSVALDPGHARGRGVQQRVDEVIGQQVDLVDVEDPLVRAGEQPGLEGLLAGQRPAEVERADEAVQRGAQRHLDERRRAPRDRRLERDLPRGPALARGEGERLVRGRLHRGQQRRQGAHRCGLGGPALAAHEHAADVRRDGVDEERLDQRLLADDRAEREQGHAPASSSSPSRARNRSRNPASVASPGCAQSPRSAASSRRSAIARAAHGFDRVMNAATSSSRT